MAISIDVGTMNLVGAKINKNKETEFKSFRNVFLPIETETLGTTDLTKIEHAIIDDDIYIIGNQALNFANIFGLTVSRPMSGGVINAGEIDSADVLSAMVGSIIGEGDGEICCYSYPADTIDANTNTIYHKGVFDRIIRSCGYTPVALNEALAVIYATCSDTDFTGIGISFGAGMTNVAISYKSALALDFSVNRGGDYIDSNAAQSVGSTPNRMSLIKEKNLDLAGPNSKKKKEKRSQEALIYYYDELIQYVISLILKKLIEHGDNFDFPDEMPIIISGGTSKVSGFMNKVNSLFAESSDKFPFDISEVRMARDPMTAVAEGCLIKASMMS